MIVLIHLSLTKGGLKVHMTSPLEEESTADVFALHLLYKYSCLQEDGFYDPLSFLKAYGIPLRMIHEAYDMFAEENNCTPYEYWHDLKNSYY